MKRLLIKTILVFSVLSFSWIALVWNTYATSDWIEVITTVKVPWANCEPIANKKVKDWPTLNYKCNVVKWFWSVIKMLWKMIKYFTYIAALGWVLFIVVNGILYSMWWADPSLKDEAKKRIIWTLTWLIILFLSWVILNLIAPWIYK